MSFKKKDKKERERDVWKPVKSDLMLNLSLEIYDCMKLQRLTA